MNGIESFPITKSTSPGNGVLVVDVVAQAEAAARRLAALGSNASERRLIAMIADRAMTRVFAEGGR